MRFHQHMARDCRYFMIFFNFVFLPNFLFVCYSWYDAVHIGHMCNLIARSNQAHWPESADEKKIKSILSNASLDR